MAKQPKKRGLMSGVFRGELLGKIDSIGGEKSKSTLDRDVVKKINPRLTGPERQRLINETKIFWETYFKIAPKYEKDIKGKTKIAATPAERAVGMGGRKTTAQAKKSLGLVGMALARVAGIAAVVLGAGGFAVKKVMDSIDAYKSMRESQKETEEAIRKGQMQYGNVSKDFERKAQEAQKRGDPLGEKMARLQKQHIDIQKRETAAQMKVRTSFGFRMAQASIGGASLSPTNKRAWDAIEDATVAPFRSQKAEIQKQMKEVREQMNLEKKGLDEQAASNNHLSNLVTLTKHIAKNSSGGGAIPPTQTPSSPTLESDTTGAAPGGPPSMDSSRLAYYNSPGSLNVPNVVA